MFHFVFYARRIIPVSFLYSENIILETLTPRTCGRHILISVKP